MNIAERFDRVCSQIHEAAARSGRSAADIRLVAVSKLHEPDTVAELARHWSLRGGVPAFGENYAQEALAKKEKLARLDPGMPLEWHFIGHIQSRKARDICGAFDLIHSVDSLKVAAALQKSWSSRQELTPRALYQDPLPAQNVLVQINIGRESQKSGVAVEEAEGLLTGLAGMPGLSVKGLMCMPPEGAYAERARPYFASLRELRDKLRTATGFDLDELSMGMSQDYTVAIEEGSTLVRVGTDIFGPRI